MKLLFSVVFLSGSVLLLAQKRSHPYQYPINIGDKWADLTRKEKIEATQMPDTISRQLTSEALLETVLTHPLNYAIVFYDSPVRAVESLATRSNAYQEFLMRENGPSVILDAYRKFDPEAVTQLADSTRTYFYVRFLTIGAFMADDRFLSKFSIKEKKELVRAGLEKAAKIRNGSQTYRFTTMSVLALPMVKILYQDKTKLPKDERFRTDIERYLKIGNLNNPAVFSTIEEAALTFIRSSTR